MLASGHLDIVCEANLKLHDWAALVPVVEGAGGLMCDWNGDPLHAGSSGHAGAGRSGAAGRCGGSARPRLQPRSLSPRGQTLSCQAGRLP
jgi:3'-phosphoadenosine 5'-phosphosulfate (PAPS) 3'-phosphatase